MKKPVISPLNKHYISIYLCLQKHKNPTLKPATTQTNPPSQIQSVLSYLTPAESTMDGRATTLPKNSPA